MSAVVSVACGGRAFLFAALDRGGPSTRTPRGSEGQPDVNVVDTLPAGRHEGTANHGSTNRFAPERDGAA